MKRLLWVIAALLAVWAGPAAADPQGDFDAWLQGVKAEAIAEGIPSDIVSSALAGIRYVPSVARQDANQAQAVESFWDYLGRRVTPAHIARGQALAKEHAALLARIQQDYGVPSSIVVAIWGLESAYGSVQGKFPVIDALATRAYERQSAGWLREHLLAALRVMARFGLSRQQMTGSWGGAMGQPQFMPAAYIDYAVDYDGDGRSDIWTSIPDVFASIANHLALNGWQRERLWGREVVLPDRFDYAMADGETQRPLAEWSRLGVKRATGLPLPAEGVGRIFLPAGRFGPALLLYDNFDVIKRYNPSSYYAISVAYLGDQIAERPQFVAQRSANEPKLTRAELTELQQRLTKAGFDAGVADGFLGDRTRAALRAFQQQRRLPADGYPSPDMLARLRGVGG
jgi:membrane-bound lytic murein transglycosylase B